jgi:hypothetical protein
MPGTISSTPGAPIRRIGGVTAIATAAGCALLLAGCGDGSGASTAGSSPVSASSGGAQVISSPSGPITSSGVASGTATATVKPSTGSVKQSDGSLRVTDAENGFQLTLPRGYLRVTSKSELAAIGKAGSKVLKGSAAAAAATFTEHVELFAINTLSGSTINVVTTPSGGSTTDDLVGQADSLKAQVAGGLGAKQITMTTIKVDGDPALRANATLVNGGKTITLTQIYAVHGDNVYITTFGGPTASEKVITSVTGSLHYFA